MDTELLLQNLRDLPLEEGRACIQEHIAELSDHAAIGNLLADEALRLLYSPFVSLKLAELLIFFGEYVQHTSSHALGLKAKGDALVQIGHFQAAMESLDTAGDEFLHLGDEGNWARSRISWITACASLGHVEEALQEATLAREVFLRDGEYYWACVIDHNRALIYEGVGRYQDALKLYENMRAIYPTLTDQSEISIKRSIALAEGNQAIDLVRLGDFEKAYQLFQQALANLIALDEKDLIISAEIDLADLDFIQGYYGSALRRYYQACDSLLQNNDGNPFYLAELKLSIANCLVKLDRGQEATLLANEAVESYRSAGTSLNTGNALREYATTLVASSRSKEALLALDEAWMLLSRGGFEPHAFATKLQQAELLLEMGSPLAAYDQALLAREYFQSKGLVTRSVRASLIMAGALIEHVYQAELNLEKDQQFRHLQEAMILSRQAALQARQYHLQEEVHKSHYLLGRIFALEDNPTKAMRHFGAAIAQIERILDDLVYDLSPSFLHTTWAVYEDMIDLCLQGSQVERAFSCLEQARSMALRQYLNKSQISRGEREEQKDSSYSSLLQPNSAAILRTKYELREEQEKHRYYNVLLADIDYSVSSTVDREVIEQELKRCEKKISDLFERLNLYESSTPLKLRRSKHIRRDTKQVDIGQLRKSLAADHLLLAYYLHKGKLVIFAITTEYMVTHENPDGLAQLEGLLPLLHAHLDPRGWPDFQNPPRQVVLRLLNKLYNLLVAPVAHLFPSSRGHLTIVPYGPLHKLPFHALYDGSSYLVERFQINYVPASNILMHLEAHGSEQQTQMAVTGTSVNPPLVFGYSANGQLQRVHDEAKAVASLLNGRCYLEDEATIARLIEQAPGTPIIHLATHGQSRLDAPNFSYVRLADGQLNAIDAFSLDLKACELVTLSGCETGLALSGGGDEQLGLGRAFLAAGATSLVMSLWPVEDNATNKLMQLFYQNLLKGESKVQALRAAQCSLLHQTSLNFAHPYFWGAFRLVGDVGPLKKAKDQLWSS
jgi:tetratricopeptide (TPR) repeat protein